MKFLLDECLSQRVVSLLEEAGHDVVHVVSSALAGSVDDDVLEANQGAQLPSLILFRQGNRTPDHQAETLLANLEQVAEDLDRGAIVVFTNDNIRIRALPI